MFLSREDASRMTEKEKEAGAACSPGRGYRSLFGGSRSKTKCVDVVVSSRLRQRVALEA